MAHNNEIMPCDKCCNRKDAGCLGSTWLEESQCSRTWSYSGRRNIVGGWMVMKKLRFSKSDPVSVTESEIQDSVSLWSELYPQVPVLVE